MNFPLYDQQGNPLYPEQVQEDIEAVPGIPEMVSYPAVHGQFGIMDQIAVEEDSSYSYEQKWNDLVDKLRKGTISMRLQLMDRFQLYGDQESRSSSCKDQEDHEKR